MRRLALLTVVACAVAGCGGGDQQDADEPSGEFRVEVVEASFPRVQHIAENVELKLRVRNGSDETLRTVAVTVATEANGPDAPVAFGQRLRGNELADSARPVWVLDEGPASGDIAYVNTWLAGALRAGEERELVWQLVPSRAGRYRIDYSVSPGLTGRARAVGGRTAGSFRVEILDDPVPARVGDDGEVERGRSESSD
jgi:hypothetical protein